MTRARSIAGEKPPITGPSESGPGPVSRRSRKKEKTRRNIFSAAMGLFAARDYDAVTIEEICERADVAKATFFLHFPNKAALLTEFNERLTANLRSHLAEQGGSAEEKLRRAVQMMSENWGRNAEIMRKMTREFLNQPALPRAATDANAGLSELITEIVAQGQATGELRAQVPASLVAAMLIASWGAFVSAWSTADEEVPPTVGEELLDIMLFGLKQM